MLSQTKSILHMFTSQHSDFILTPLKNILEEGMCASRAVGDGIETYPMGEYLMQALFLKLTGAQEQKMKCICWDLATNDYEYRYEYLNRKNYKECSSYNDKNGIFNDLILAIKKVDDDFEPSSIIDEEFLASFLKEMLKLYASSVMSTWKHKEFGCFKSEVSSVLNIKQLQYNKSVKYSLFQSKLQDFYEKVVYRHRNRCAHNTLSYQVNKPDLSVLSSAEYDYHSYFFRYAIIILIDEMFIKLFEKYLSLKK